MRMHNPLDKILNSEIKIKILRFLCRTDAEWNGRQIAKEIMISPASCHKALRELNSEGLLLLRNVGKSFLFRLNKDNFITSKLLKPLYHTEEKIPHILFNTIKRNFSSQIKNSITSLAVFGSIGKKEEKAQSDIDILVILKNTKSRRVIAYEFDKINKKISAQFGNTISPYFQSISELRHKKKHPLIKNILKSHILLFGKPISGILSCLQKR